jgi:sec-independent protein translocase protein TatA
MYSLAFISNLASGPGLIVLLLIVLLFGAKRLPELGKSLGATLREFSKGKEGEEDDEEKKDLKDKKDPKV